MRYILIPLLFSLFSMLQAQEYIKDIDGNKYEVVEHNGYLIMTENLRTSRFRDGSKLKRVKWPNNWQEAVAAEEEAYTYVNDLKSTASLYGVAYSQEAIKSSKGLAPEGWFIPSAAEWKEILWFKGNDYLEANTSNKEKTLYLVNGDAARAWRKKVAKGKESIINLSEKFGATANGFRNSDGYFTDEEIGFFGCGDGGILIISTKAEGGSLIAEPSEDFSTNAGVFVRCVKKIED